MTPTHFNKALPLAVILVAAACSAPTRDAAPEHVNGVTTAVAIAATVPDVYETTGSVRAATTSNLAAKVMGNVTRVLVSEGDTVRTGQLLVQLDPRESAIQVNKARAGSEEIEAAIAAASATESAAAANATIAESALRRYRVLRERGSVSPHELEQIEAQQKAAAAELLRARATHEQMFARRAEVKADLASAATFAGYDEIRSPIDGVVTAKHVDEGSQAAPGMILVTVEDATSSRVDAFVPETVGAQIHRGDAAEIEIGADIVTARVKQIVSALDPATRTALVTLELGKNSRSGQVARVRFAIGERRALAVPSAAIVARGQLRTVFVVDGEGIARLRMVTTGRTFRGNVEILSGLDAGERFVTNAPPQLRDGAEVAR